MANKSLKILGISVLTLSLLAGCGKKPSSSEPSSSEPQTSESVNTNSSSSSSSSIQEKGYNIEIGDTKIDLTKEESTDTSIKELYTATLASVTAGQEVVFYVDGNVKRPSVTQLGNNIVLNESYKTEIHNDATNVKLSLKVLENGLEVWLDGFQKKVISSFQAKVNDDVAEITVDSNLSQGVVYKFTVTLSAKDKLTVYGDNSKLCYGDNAMHYETEYVAPLPGEYVVEINEYNRVSVTEPVLTTEELYLVYINDEKVEANFETVMKDNNRAEFYFDVLKGDEFKVVYADGTVLGSGSADFDYTHRVYINEKGEYYTSKENIDLNITATADEETIELHSVPVTGSDLACYTIEVEVGQVIEFFSGDEALIFGELNETSFTAEATTYKVFINEHMKVYLQEYVPEVYTEVIASGVTASLIENRKMHVWAWKTESDGRWVEQSPKVNTDGTVTVYIPQGLENFLIITTETNKTASWDNVKSQTNDVKIVGTTATVTWKKTESASSSTPNIPENPATSVPTDKAVVLFEIGSDWENIGDIYVNNVKMLSTAGSIYESSGMYYAEVDASTILDLDFNQGSAWFHLTTNDQETSTDCNVTHTLEVGKVYKVSGVTYLRENDSSQKFYKATITDNIME